MGRIIAAGTGSPIVKEDLSASHQQIRARAKTPTPKSTDTLSMEDLVTITKEVMQGVAPTLTSEEALAFRQKIQANLAEFKAKGMGVKLVTH